MNEDKVMDKFSTAKLFFDKKGNPITIEEFVELMCLDNYKIVKQKHVNGHFVSTVFLGINTNFLGGDPVCFETMIFPVDCSTGNVIDYQERYSTEEQALIGHDMAVEYAKSLKGVE